MPSSANNLRIPGDPLARVIIIPGTTDWHDHNNDNWVKTVGQINGFEQRVSDVRVKMIELQDKFAKIIHPYDFSVFVPSKPPAGITILRAVVPPDRYCEIEQGVVGAVSAGVAPTTSVSYNVLVNGALVGTATLSAGLTRGNVVFTRSVTLQPYDTLVIQAPEQEDASLEDLAISIRSGALRDDEIPEEPVC